MRPAAQAGRAPRFDARLLERLGVPVTRLCSDSRKLRRGDLFLAYRGETADGRDFIPQALAAGAAAVLWEKRGFAWKRGWRAPNLAVSNLRARAGVIASQVYGDPSRRLWVVGATGTNGKTSCTHWIAQSAAALGRRFAVMGTLGNGFPGRLAPAPTTTADAVTLQESLAGYLREGAQGAALEVSSHALDQGRVNGVRFAVALFTNLSRDHLDYHRSMARYAAAKARLFRWPGLRHAVVNLDDAFGRELAQQLRDSTAQRVGYGFGAEAERAARRNRMAAVLGRRLEVSERGIAFEVESDWGGARLASSMLGRFNAENLLATLATLLTSGVALADAVVALAQVEPVPGRLQQLGGGRRPLVVVDYAHTPDALEKVLKALREAMTAERGARLICVFGCGGERDRGKRPLMGAAVARLADWAVVTSDNPRGEAPREIIDEVLEGMGGNCQVVEDRASAIFEAIRGARRGDVVLIAGKGREAWQEIAGRRLPFSDAEVALKALAATARGGGE